MEDVDGWFCVVNCEVILRKQRAERTKYKRSTLANSEKNDKYSLVPTCDFSSKVWQWLMNYFSLPM